MVQRIDKLTAEQEAQLANWADKWIDFCLRAGPTDRQIFEAAVAKCYRAAGKPWHGKVVWLPSPAGKAILPGDANDPAGYDPRFEKLNLFTPTAKQFLKTQDWRISNTWTRVRWAIIGQAINTVLMDIVEDSLPPFLHPSGWDSSYLDMPLWWLLGDNLNTCHQHSWPWEFGHVSLIQAIMKWPDISLFRNVLGITLPGDVSECLEAFEAASKEVLGWYPANHYVIAWERPTTIHTERQPSGERRLHADHGPAVVFPDGWSIYAIHGVVIPTWQRHIVEQPETITVTDIEVEIEGGNAEVRRIMIERYGAARFLADSGACIVLELPADHASVGLRGARLLRKKMPQEESMVYVDLLNSTPEPDGSVKRYMLRVDPEAYDGEASRNVHAAAASTWRNADGSLVYADWRDYRPWAES